MKLQNKIASNLQMEEINGHSRTYMILKNRLTTKRFP